MHNKARILVVDDEPSVCRNIEKMLLREGYDVHIAVNVESALNALKKGPFDLALFDVVMPDFNGRLSKRAGIDLLEKIRKDGYDLPVIMLSATSDSLLADKAITTYKANQFLVKGSLGGREFTKIIKSTLDDSDSQD